MRSIKADKTGKSMSAGAKNALVPAALLVYIFVAVFFDVYFSIAGAPGEYMGWPARVPSPQA